MLLTVKEKIVTLWLMFCDYIVHRLQAMDQPLTVPLSIVSTPNSNDNVYDEVDTALRFSFKNNSETKVDRLTHPIKIETDGSIFFKIKNKWIHQPNITAIEFGRE